MAAGASPSAASTIATIPLATLPLPMTDTLAKILVADDEPDLRALLQRYLSDQGYTVRTVEGAGPLDTLLQRERFDVLVLDVYMPEVRGPELAAVVREQDAYLHLPILFLSAETDISQQLLALNLGGDDFLIKPVQPAHLISAVMARARRARQNKATQLRLQQTLYEREREHQAHVQQAQQHRQNRDIASRVVRHHLHQRIHPRLVADATRHQAFAGPAAVAIHDDGDVAGQRLGRLG